MRVLETKEVHWQQTGLRGTVWGWDARRSVKTASSNEFSRRFSGGINFCLLFFSVGYFESWARPLISRRLRMLRIFWFLRFALRANWAETLSRLLEGSYTSHATTKKTKQLGEFLKKQINNECLLLTNVVLRKSTNCSKSAVIWVHNEVEGSGNSLLGFSGMSVLTSIWIEC